MSERRTAKVSALVHYLKNLTEGDPLLQGVRVEGEISNMRRPYSGHWYFSLKDERASISCVMFAGNNRKLLFQPNNGDKVIITGNVSVYEAGGQLQIIATNMMQAGAGDLYRQLELLKNKLYQEGLFDPAHKKPLPQYPLNIALVTGNQTAAREDVLITLRKRWPIAEIHEYPCPVQGTEAVPKIIAALQEADRGGHQIILLVRGGGSIEDLWCFNDEQLARTIYAMHTPVVTGIGHEIDFTLSDYVADLRANTPTGAVEATVPDQMDVRKHILSNHARLQQLVQSRLTNENRTLQRYQSCVYFTDPQRLYSEKTIHLQMISERMKNLCEQSVNDHRLQLQQLNTTFYRALHHGSASIQKVLDQYSNDMKVHVNDRIKSEYTLLQNSQKQLVNDVKKSLDNSGKELLKQTSLLDAYSPLKVLERGYSIVYHNEHVFTSIENIDTNDKIDIRMSDGILHAEVIAKEKLHE